MTGQPEDEQHPVGEVGTVYLIHFDRRYKHAGHYTGWTKDLSARIAEHLKGQGARLMEVITEAGITWQVVRTWEGTRSRERAIKNRHEAPKLCPQCSLQPRPVTAGRSAAVVGTTRQADAGPVAQPAVPAPERVPAFERGAAQARASVGRQIEAGMTADRITAAQQAMFRDFNPQTASPQTRERYQGYQAAAAEMISTHRQAQHAEAELADAELEVG
jgi:predicted GIY-YIG superfamily endonuclease